MLIFTATSTEGVCWSHVISKVACWACLNWDPSGCRAGGSFGTRPRDSQASAMHHVTLQQREVGAENRGNEWEEWKNRGRKVQGQGDEQVMKLEPFKNKRSMAQTVCVLFLILLLFSPDPCSSTNICTQYLIPLVQISWWDAFTVLSDPSFLGSTFSPKIHYKENTNT